MDSRFVSENIITQLDEFAHGAGFTDCVIGLSGGLDSSVVAALCVPAFGAEHVHGVLLPGPYSTDHASADALELAANLGIQTESISITGAYEALAQELAPHTGGSFEGLASENTQARLRMVVLMALSNAHGWMLVNTGNLSEAWMGYSTLYGDTAGAFAPIGGLYKTEVYELANWLNERAREQGGGDIIPQHVINKPPSAELAPNQTDEAALDISYPELDRILMGYFEQGQSPETLATVATPVEEIERIIARAEGYAYKRAQLPPAAIC